VGLRFASTYTPLYPPNPANEESWTDPNTEKVWYYFDEGGWIESDPYWENVALLLHLDGAEGSTVFTDSSVNNLVPIEPSSSIGITTQWSRYGTGSLNLSEIAEGEDGAGLAYQDAPELNFNGGDFTAEFFLNFSFPDGVYEGDSVPFFIADLTILQGAGLSLNYNGSGNLGLFYSVVGGGIGPLVGSSVAPTQGSWQHYAVVKNADTITLYLDGVSVCSGLYPSGFSSSDSIFFGMVEASITPGRGIFMDEVRVTMGVARYTSNFSPPTEPFPDFQGSLALLD
jgi:hypothetical protein